MKYIYFLILGLCVPGTALWAQNGARITGNLQTNGNFFIEDSIIGATATPQYDYQKFGSESWLNLNYSNWGFDIGVRFDLFNNSNLLNPTGSYTDEGIGRWYVQKTVGKLDLSAGYLYDQIGSGIIFRAYEERALLIDNALYGAKVGYTFNENWKVRGFMGRQKRQFTRYGSTLRGAALEGFIKPDSTKNFALAPGIGVVSRTYDEGTINQIVGDLATYLLSDREGVQYNTYAATLYNTLTAGNFIWYVEGAAKTKDVMFNPFEERYSLNRETDKLDTIVGKLTNRNGYTVYTSFAYAKKGFGATLELKRTKDFAFRSAPGVGVQGIINFLPPMAKQNTYRLTARFAPATQELGEQAVQLDLKYKLNKSLSLGLNFSDITLIDGEGFLNLDGVTQLYREIAPEFTYKHKRKWQFIGGVQFLKYNILVYQGKDSYVDAVTPFAELLYKFSPRKSLRVEAQYLATEEEFGSWANLVAEFGWAPHWLIYASDMYKIPHRNKENYPAEKTKYDGLHYPSVGIVYTHKANRYSIAYVKQVEGINCAGGICRLEPTFHGVRLNVASSF
jgi:hypothetical protein